MDLKITLEHYLTRSNHFWKLYNQEMKLFMNENPNLDGAPFEGSFPHVGISLFYRHGAGIRIESNKEIIEFDFIQFHYKNKDFLDIGEIDSFWAFTHYNSYHIGMKTSQETWDAEMDKLVSNGILKKYSAFKYGFS